MSDECKEAFLPPTNKTRYGDVVDIGDECYIKTGHDTGTSTHYQPLSGFSSARRLTLSHKCKPDPLPPHCSQKVLREDGSPWCIEGPRTTTRDILAAPLTNVFTRVTSSIYYWFWLSGTGWDPFSGGANFPDTHNYSKVFNNWDNYSYILDAARINRPGLPYFYYTGYPSGNVLWSVRSPGSSNYTNWSQSMINVLTDGRPEVGIVGPYHQTHRFMYIYYTVRFAYPVTIFPGKYACHGAGFCGRPSCRSWSLPPEEIIWSRNERSLTRDRSKGEDSMLRNDEGDPLMLPIYYKTHFPGTHATEANGADGYYSYSTGKGWGSVYTPPNKFFMGHGMLQNGVVPEVIEGIYEFNFAPFSSAITTFDIENIAWSAQTLDEQVPMTFEHQSENDMLAEAWGSPIFGNKLP